MFQFFTKFLNPYQTYSQEAPPSNPWRFMVKNLKGFWPLIAISLFMTIICAGLEVWLIGYAGRLVDNLTTTTPQDLWQSHGTEFLIVIALTLIIRPFAPLLREGINDIIFRPNAVALIRWRLHHYIVQQSLSWFENDMAGRIAGHVRDAGTSATGAAYQILNTLSYVFVYIIGSIWLMAVIDIRLIWPMLAWLVIYLGLMLYVVPKFQQKSAEFQNDYSALNGMLVDTYSHIATVKLFAADNKFEDKQSDQKIEATRLSFVGLQKVEVTINIGLLFISSLLIVGMVVYSVVLWQIGAATIGLVATSIALSFRISLMSEWLMDGMSNLYGFLGALRESLKILAQPLAIKDVADAPNLHIGGGEIIFSDIQHQYGQNNHLNAALNGVSLTIAAGEKVGLVGKSGAGKSTLVNLLLRFYELEQGQICIDGQDIRQIKQTSLRQNIGMVTQDAALLHRSIAQNIAYGREAMSREEIIQAAQKAHAHEFIMQLQDDQGRTGYDVEVGERGVKLSGGQRQRIALARVMLKNAPILILDEATSALDSEVEAAIQDSLYDVMHGKTVIAIAHRLSTIAQMDRIIVLDKGIIAEQGSHDELLKKRGIYAKLWDLQSGGYLGIG
ncbi:MAG: ABC transporter ATP-binding protein [Alphaproteobacteria bacterium]|nr:ABC transporter ATP-binding protein [Alphaproteobacteria bacterium]